MDKVELRIIHYTKNTIVNIDHDGISYKDDQNKVLHIDFNECRRNWFEHVSASDDFNAYISHVEETVCVGNRNISGNPPYIELFTTPKTRFEFRSSKTILEYLLRQQPRSWVQDFHVLQRKIGFAGWSTFDVT